MSQKSTDTGLSKNILEMIFVKLLGYTLLLLGVVVIFSVTYQILNFYNYPELVNRFAIALQDLPGEEMLPLSLLKIAAWQIVIVLMLTAGKIAMWLIEAGQRLAARSSS
jgi:hypothetical protein